MSRTVFNSFFTTKLENTDFARIILKLRKDFESEIDRLVDYRQNSIISSNTLMHRTDQLVNDYDKMFIKEFEQLVIEEKIRLIASWKEFSDLAEQGLFEDSDILLSAARIVK